MQILSMIDNALVQFLQLGSKKIWLFTIWQWLLGVILPVGLLATILITENTYELVGEWGELAFTVLFIILILPPLARLLPQIKFIKKLLPLRKEIGISMFYLAFFHGLAYFWTFPNLGVALDELWQILSIPQNAWELMLLAGLVGLTVCAVLFITSNTYSLRLLQRGWKKLHMIVWFLLGFTLVHVIALGFAQGKTDEAIEYIVMTVIVLGLRGIVWWRARQQQVTLKTSA